MDVQEMVAKIQDAATVERVYGEPYEKDGVSVIPAAKLSAQGGSGAARGGEHSGGGIRVDAEPVGAYVIRGGEVEWQPVFDLSAVVLRGQLVGMVALLVLWAVVRVLRSR
ncbi:MAG: sporulation protein [Actinomycetota bacterium]|nr:sporulation protein [Actinomycetota bacterium]